jgi:preprotein translocase subunit SecB
MSDQKDGQNGGSAPAAGADAAAAAAAVGTAAGGTAAGDAAQAPQPRLSILTQYIKDMSFENPRAPQPAPQSAGRPEIQIKVDVGADAMGEDRYQVTLQLNVDAKSAGETIFLMELSYSGVFQLQNIPKDNLQALVMIECPRLLFPFARRIVADATRDGGFPPLMIDPIDFVTLYRRKLQEAQAQAQAQPQAPS